MSNAEARAWWDDVQHLRPDAAPAARRSRSASALKSVDDLPSAAELDAWLAEDAAPNRFTRAAAGASAEDLVAVDAEPPAEVPGPAPRAHRPPRQAVPVEVALERRPSPAGDRATSGAEGLLPARAAEVAAAAGPALRRAAREVGERRPRSPLDRTMSAPDRIAMWAVILGLLLVVIAATTSSAQAAVL